MNILLADDNEEFIASFIDKYEEKYDITTVENIPLMDEYLFDEPGIDEYKAILLDLDIGLGDYSVDEWVEYCAEFKNSTLFLLNGTRSLYGWDYYNSVICKRDISKSKQAKFILFSGHVDALRRQAPIDQIQSLGGRLVKKGALTSEEKWLRLIYELCWC